MRSKKLFLIVDIMGNDYRKEERAEKRWEDRAPSTRTRWLIILGLLIFTAAIFGGGYAYEQSMVTWHLTMQNQSLHSVSNPSPTSSSYSISTPPSIPATLSEGRQPPVTSAE
jgi:hypothetical protein